MINSYLLNLVSFIAILGFLCYRNIDLNYIGLLRGSMYIEESIGYTMEPRGKTYFNVV